MEIVKLCFIFKSGTVRILAFISSTACNFYPVGFAYIAVGPEVTGINDAGNGGVNLLTSREYGRYNPAPVDIVNSSEHVGQPFFFGKALALGMGITFCHAVFFLMENINICCAAEISRDPVGTSIYLAFN